MSENLILLSDSYKYSHHNQTPPGITKVVSYLSARTPGIETVFFGLDYIIKKHLVGQVVTAEKIKEAKELIDIHLGPGIFNEDGWNHILHDHDGYLPLHIRAPYEGSVIPSQNALLNVTNTCPRCYWLVNFIETILVQLWYPITVATYSRECKKVILEFLEKTGDPGLIYFKLHDFGFRGTSSCESAAIGGAAHLLNFKGTDTVAGISMLHEFYDAPLNEIGFSIPAMEHYTVSSWGKDDEKDAYENMLDKYPSNMVACVSDTYDIFNACEYIWGDQLKERVLTRNNTVVIRPDSGDPAQTVLSVIRILSNKFGGITNEKGYFVLHPNVRVIQGDGVNINSIREILEVLERNKFSADNIAFGMGGSLLQEHTRDRYGFAMKASYIEIEENNKINARNIFKNPVGMPEKASRGGDSMLYYEFKKDKTFYYTVDINNIYNEENQNGSNAMESVFLNGKYCYNANSLFVMRQDAKVNGY